MKDITKKSSIGLRLKLAIVIPVNAIVILFGIILYNYQKEIIFEQAKQNSYATIADLIRFIENEIQASKDKIGYFGQAALTYMDGLGAYRQDTKEYIAYRGTIAGNGNETTLNVPAIYRGETRLQGDTAIYTTLKKMGIIFFQYYQKTDDYYVEILNSQNQQALLNNETILYPINYSGTWRFNSLNEPIYTTSHWTGKTWAQTARLFVLDEYKNVTGIIIVGIEERNEQKLVNTFVNKTFYETGFCYQIHGDNGEFSYHPRLPFRFKSDNLGIQHIVAEKMIKHPSFVTMTDSTGIDKYLFYQYFPTVYHNLVIEIPEREIFTSLHVLRNGILIAVILLVIFVYLTITYFVNSMTSRLNQAVNTLKQLALGDTSGDNSLLSGQNDEIGNISTSVIELKQNLNSISTFAGAIGLGKLETKYEPLSDKDKLGNSLLGMQKSLLKAKIDEEQAKIEDEKNRWTSDGLAKFSDIIRLSDTAFKDLAYNMLKNLVDYLGISMGALYVAEEENDEKVYIPLAAVAYERQKIIDQKILFGEGLIGRCAHEKLTIYMKDIPDQYISIKSGLGGANPGYLLIVPLISNDEVMGVIELASFNDFEDYKKDFIEKLGESIGSTLKSAKINQQTVELLKQAKIQSEELAAQEEEMRQNMEELQSTQEEAQRREAEIMGVVESVDKSVFKVEYDTNGIITDINTKYAMFLNTTADTILRKNITYEFNLLGCKDNTVKNIISSLSTGQGYSATIQAQVKGQLYSIQEYYTPIKSTVEGSAQRIIKISFVVG